MERSHAHDRAEDRRADEHRQREARAQFGIFAGWSLGEISRRDRGYLQWLLNRPEARAFREEIVHLLDPEGPESVDKGRRGSR